MSRGVVVREIAGIVADCSHRPHCAIRQRAATSAGMADPANVVPKVEAGRAVFVRDLRALADELERLSVRDAGEVFA